MFMVAGAGGGDGPAKFGTSTASTMCTTPLVAMTSGVVTLASAPSALSGLMVTSGVIVSTVRL